MENKTKLFIKKYTFQQLKIILKGALSGLMLDLGLLKIIWLGVLFLAPAGASNPAGP